MYFLLLLTLDMNGGSIASEESIDRAQGQQKIDIYGRLTDRQGYSFAFNNLSIGGAIERIPFYQKPACPTDNARLNERTLNLTEIRQIQTVSQKNACNVKEIHTFNNRSYIELIINLVDGTKHNYIIESSRRIFCNEIKPSDPQAIPIEAKISFQTVDKLVIQGYRGRSTRSTVVPIAQQQKLSHLRVDSFLKDIKQNVNQFLGLQEEKSNDFMRQQQPFLVSFKKISLKVN